MLRPLIPRCVVVTSSPSKEAQHWHLRPIKAVRLSDFAVEQITALIEGKQFSVGDKLPGERALMQQLGIGRASVREALRQLESQGLVTVRPGKGTFVANSISPSELIPALTEWFEEHDQEWLEVLEVREELECQAVFLAARHAPSEMFEELTDVVDRMASFVEKDELMWAAQTDREFHRLLYNASGNSFLRLLGDSIIVTMFGSRYSLIRVPGYALQSIHEHRAIVNAIRNRDPVQAENAVREHVRNVRNTLHDLLQTQPERFARDAPHAYQPQDGDLRLRINRGDETST